MRRWLMCVAMAGLAAAPQAQSVPAASLNKPYTVELEQRREQTLADGTHIVQITHQRQYRDSQGRTRREFDLQAETGDSARTSVSVADVPARKTLNWMIGNHMESVYWVSNFPSPSTTGSATLQTAPPNAASSRPRFQRTREALGTQEVQGVPCTATRMTTIYPIDSIGNDRPFTVVQESCTSSELGLVLRSQWTDPRSGTSSVTAVSVNRTEPDASLFQPPAGFTERVSMDTKATVGQ